MHTRVLTRNSSEAYLPVLTGARVGIRVWESLMLTLPGILDADSAGKCTKAAQNIKKKKKH